MQCNASSTMKFCDVKQHCLGVYFTLDSNNTKLVWLSKIQKIWVQFTPTYTSFTKQ